jgi:hypothetical protein
MTKAVPATLVHFAHSASVTESLLVGQSDRDSGGNYHLI